MRECREVIAKACRALVIAIPYLFVFFTILVALAAMH